MTIDKAQHILKDEALLQKKAHQYHIDPEQYRQELSIWIAIEEAKSRVGDDYKEVSDLTTQLINLQRTIDAQRG